jgi:RNA polymerase sigma-70 factor, ECF subfamily
MSAGAFAREIGVLDSRHSQPAVSTPSASIDYEKVRRDLARAVARLCPHWLVDQRDDLVQAAVMRVMQVSSRRTTEGEGNTPLGASYLYKAAYSALVDEIRRVRRRRETGLEDQTVEPTAEPADPERQAASRQIGAGIADCLTRLADDRRLAVTLYLQGHSVPESARVLGWAAKRTENLVYRGLTDLRGCLESKGMRP